MRRTADAIVVGAGIVGAACALALARAGLEVLVLEANFAASGATGAGMGHIVVLDDSPAQFALTARSAALWDELVEVLPPACEQQACGTLWLAVSDAELAAAATRAGSYREHGVRAEILDRTAVLEAEPELRADLVGALWVAGDRVVYAPAVTRYLLEQAVEHGAEIWEGFQVRQLRAGRVEGHGETVACGQIVNAAGAAAPRLTPGLPIIPRKGHLLITERLPAFCSHQLVELGYLESAHSLAGASVAFNVQPRATGQVLIGSSRELVGWEPDINPEVLARMLARALTFLPALGQQTALRAWTGFRPATPDGLPLIGAWPEVPGLWIAAGHEGLGITAALGTAELLAHLVCGTPTSLAAAPYAPTRQLAFPADA